MRSIYLSLVIVALMAAGCIPKGPEPVAKSQPQQKPRQANPHAQTAGPGLDIDALLAELPEGWSKVEASSSMRIAELKLARASGDTADAELAIFHFPGTGGSAAANIQRWQGQYVGPNREPGPEIAITDTMRLYGITIVTTDVTGIRLPSSMGMGPSVEVPDSRMIASVIETGVGNWFVKVNGPTQTVGEHELRIREFLKKVKLKEEPGA